MSDKIEREIEEILNRLEEPVPEEDVPDRVRGLSLDWAANLHRSIVSRLAGISLRRIMLASFVLVVLVAVGLFFGLVYPSLGGSGTSAASAGGEILREGADDHIGDAVHVDDAHHEGSDEGAEHTDDRESHEGVDHSPEHLEEHEGHEGH